MKFDIQPSFDDFLNQVLPTFGNSNVNLPVWDEAQSMFITDQFVSASGHRYYKGIRFSGQLVLVEKVGLYHTMTYIDGIELYTFDGNKLKLIARKDYDRVFYNSDFIKQHFKDMLKHYLLGAAQSLKVSFDEQQLEEQVNGLMSVAYKSFLQAGYNTKMMKVFDLLKEENTICIR